AKCPDRVSHRNPPGVGQMKRFQVERAGHRSTAEVGSLIAQAFLVRKAEYLYGKRETLLSLVQALHTGKCNHHAERTVILARVAHAVEMGTEEQGFRTLGTRLVAPDEITDRILLDGHASCLHPFSYGFVCLAHCA